MSLSIVPSLGVGDAGISCDVHTDFEKYCIPRTRTLVLEIV